MRLIGENASKGIGLVQHLDHSGTWFNVCVDGQILSAVRLDNLLSSSLQAVAASNMNHSLVVDVVSKYHRLTVSGNIVKFYWVPGHVFIKGNEAKAAITNAVSNCRVPFSNAK